MSVPRQKRGKETGWGVNTTGKSAPFANAIKKHTPISQFVQHASINHIFAEAPLSKINTFYRNWVTMNQHIFFFLGLSFMLMHEMDAIRCKEWRIFPGLSLLNDNWGYRIFMFAHIPLFIFLFLGLHEQIPNERLISGMDIFFIVHVGLHLLFLMHKRNEFKDWISWTIISGTGLFGLLDLMI